MRICIRVLGWGFLSVGLIAAMTNAVQATMQRPGSVGIAILWASTAVVGLLMLKPPQAPWVTSRRMLVGAAQSLAYTFLGVILIRIGDSFSTIYRDFDARLPDCILTLLNAVTLLHLYWYFAVPLLVAWPFVNARTLHVFEAPGEKTLLGRMWRDATWALPVLVFMGASIAMIYPLATMSIVIKRS